MRVVVVAVVVVAAAVACAVRKWIGRRRRRCGGSGGGARAHLKRRTATIVVIGRDRRPRLVFMIGHFFLACLLLQGHLGRETGCCGRLAVDPMKAVGRNARARVTAGGCLSRRKGRQVGVPAPPGTHASELNHVHVRDPSLNFPASRGETRNAKCLRGAFCWLHRNFV
ncbi:hypothetical protein FA10DRAFT_27012 [Acaromyces ingoldii]|uniref:Uncharacterized protein n=1 Tax=Acaromyces ingoldii TaxID=215250 RepID=A0A316YVJ8_9BASI|nr:hypothetical protein FA10DRAFT_27012 [Acaromyces ingoldii]PWN93600.1 hypothetical protein FA10DRAFT_27012 [Acaromyces ingoldii]